MNESERAMRRRRVVILGGAGYIGRTLLGLYLNEGFVVDGESEDVEVVVVDRLLCLSTLAVVQSQPGWSYVQADIGDMAVMRRLIVDQRPDIVYLLAGQIEAETSPERTKEMWLENYDKAAAIMDLCAEPTKLFFPSSANVFGGNREDVSKVFDETEAPQPMFPYALTKAAMEALLEDWGGNRVVARLGTNHGWAPGIRWNLVVNLFTLRAAQGKRLSIYGDGKNCRPFVHNRDCARAIKFLSERDDTGHGIYHVVQESMDINAIAEHVKRYVADVPSRHEAFRPGFASYQMSSLRLRALGFQFQWDIASSIQDIANQLTGLEA